MKKYIKQKKQLKRYTDAIKGIKVAAISPGVEDFDLEKKGLEYDPYLQDFIIGCGGKISSFNLQEGTKNALVIRGLGGGSQKALKYCIENNIDYYAIDTGYLQPSTRKDYHRVSKNGLQNLGPIKDRDNERLGKLNWKWRKPSTPSDKPCKFYGINRDDFVNSTIEKIRQHTDRPIIIRDKVIRRDRVGLGSIYNQLDDDNIFAVVTYNSIAATEAVGYGVPCFTLAPNAADFFLCSNDLRDIARPASLIPEKADVIAYAQHLSYCQFTAQELKNGTAWKLLNS